MAEEWSTPSHKEPVVAPCSSDSSSLYATPPPGKLDDSVVSGSNEVDSESSPQSSSSAAAGTSSSVLTCSIVSGAEEELPIEENHFGKGEGNAELKLVTKLVSTSTPGTSGLAKKNHLHNFNFMKGLFCAALLLRVISWCCVGGTVI